MVFACPRYLRALLPGAFFRMLALFSLVSHGLRRRRLMPPCNIPSIDSMPGKAMAFLALCLFAVLLEQRPVHAEEVPTRTVLIGFAGGLGKKDLANNFVYSARDGAQMAVDDANQRNIVIAGRRVVFKLLLTDDQSDANFARITAKSFVAAGIVGVIGHIGTASSVAAAPLYAEAGIPQISPTSTGREFSKAGYRTVFQLLGHSDITAIHLAQIALETLKAKRIAVIDNGTTLGVQLADGFIRKISQVGNNILFRESINNKTSDFNAVLSRVKSEHVDLVLFAGVGAQATAFSENCQRLGVRAQLLLNGGAINPEFPNVGVHVDGTFILIHGQPVETRPGYEQFEKFYKKKFDSTLTVYTLFSYDAVGMLIEALRKANSFSPKTAVETLHGMQYKGISGAISFAADGSQNNPPYTLYRATQKKWQVVKIFGG